MNAAQSGLKKNYKTGFKFKKVGVLLLRLQSDQGFQGNLFFQNNPRHDCLQKVIDEINQKHGRNTVHCSPKQDDAN